MAKILQLVIYLSGLAGFADKAAAQAGNPSITIINPVGTDSFQVVVQKVMSALITIATPIVAIMVLVGGFQILTAGGDPEKFGKGKKTILYAVIGYAVIILADGVVLIIKDILGAG